MNRKIWTCVFLALVVLVAVSPGETQKASTARVWEEKIVLPTYLIDKGDPNPRFYNGRVYQGAQGRVYPWPLFERLTDKRVDKAYDAVYLENEYIQLSLLPEIGGRIFSGLDKGNKYDFIYRQHVIKPGLIGMLGAWITGGVEWNVFHHHRATSFLPIDYTFQQNPDGSATAWIGETEIRHRMKWSIGVTVYPGKSYFEVTFKPFNRTPLINSFLYFANLGVHTGPDYQVVFPPTTEWVTQHAKREFAGWPIAHEVYNRVDFSEGVDVSWWKTNDKQISYFCWNYEEDFFAGYDHGKEAGTCVVANHHIGPGKKFWTWGSGARGEVWTKLLTDSDGPELELMAGGYSDNEPDYSFIQPYESKVLKQYFYPIRKLGQLKSANIEAAVSLEVTDKNVAKFGFNTTSVREKARVRLAAGDRALLEETIDIDPNTPYTKDVPLPAGIAETDLRVSLAAANGVELVAYAPKKKRGTPVPEAVKAPPAPKDVKTVEELYLTGVRLDQFHHPSLDPMAYFEEALKRDPGESRVNVAVGIIKLRQARLDEAEKFLKTGLDRVTAEFYRPREGEAYYYHGLALMYLGRYDEAYTDLYQATWSSGFHSAAYYELARIDCRRNDFPTALDHLDRSLSTNVNNLSALTLKAVVLRKLGRTEEAAKLAANIGAMDVLDFWSRNELYLAKAGLGEKEQAAEVLNSLAKKMRDDVESTLELSLEYGNLGLWDEGLDLLSRLIEKKSTHPLLYYYAGYYSEQKGDAPKAGQFYAQAGKMPPDYCFPYRTEEVAILRAAMKNNPRDAMAPYYLGNLLYEKQPAEAIRQWETSRSLGGNFSTLHRNLGYGYDLIEGDIPKALASYEKAIACDPKDTRIIFEYDALNEKAQNSPLKRLAFLEKHHKTLVTSTYLLPLESEIRLHVQLGEYDKAIEMTRGLHFRRWEGGPNVFGAFVDANVLRGLEHFRAKRFDKALKYLSEAATFPLNMEASEDFAGGRTCEVEYWTGTVYEAMGNAAKARECYEKAVAERQYYDELDVSHYYRGLALKKLGKTDEAAKLFDGLLKQEEADLTSIETSTGVSFFAKFGERDMLNVRRARAHYLMGLAYLGKGDRTRAKEELDKATRLNINLLWARALLAGMK
jgi:tetratricopeptide (TPR) repeat protein